MGEENEVSGRDVLGTFDHTMDVVTMRLILLLDDKHRQLGAVTLEAGAKALGVQFIGKVAEVLLGKRVRDPQRSNRDQMPTDRRHRLEALGFIWDLWADAWEEGFSKLKAFKAREGHWRVAALYVLDGFKLGSWVNKQRTNKAHMSADRRLRLDALGFVWDTRKTES